MTYRWPRWFLLLTWQAYADRLRRAEEMCVLHVDPVYCPDGARRL